MTEEEAPLFPQAVLDRLAAGLSAPSPNACWVWTKGKNAKGYGWIAINRKCHYVHRVVMMLTLGRLLASNEVVMHKCDNPSCANPRHLELGDLHTNIADAVQKGRHNPHVRKKRSRLTPEKVLAIKLGLKHKQGILALSIRFLVGQQTIRDIRDNRTWKHIKIPELKTPYDPFSDE